MDYEDMKSELEDAGIDVFDFYLMDEDERKAALNDAFLDPDDYEYFDIEYKYSDDNYIPDRSHKSVSVPDINSVPKQVSSNSPSPVVQRPDVALSKSQDNSNIYSSHENCQVKSYGTDMTYETMGEYSFDHDTGKVIYHYGDGFATDDAGNQYMEVGGGHVVDLDTNEVHYSPSEHSSSYDYSTDISLWAYVGVGSLLFCILYTLMIFNTDAKYFFHALATGLLAVYAFSAAKK